MMDDRGFDGHTHTHTHLMDDRLDPEFQGEIIRDDLDTKHWPLKHDWFRTTEYPEGLWEVRKTRRKEKEEWGEEEEEENEHNVLRS